METCSTKTSDYATVEEQGNFIPITGAAQGCCGTAIILNRDGSLTTEGTHERVARCGKDTIEVPEALVRQQPDLIDRIFALAFDVLGLQTIDVRIRPASFSGHPATSCPIRETACVPAG